MSTPHPLLPGLVAQFGVREGELAVGGRRVSDLAAEFGTPLFLYDAALLRDRLATLRAHLPARVDVFYSVKANPNPAVIAVFAQMGAGLEIASGGEYLRARRGGGTPERILFAGPAKGRAELQLVLDGGIGEIHLESMEELETVAELAAGRAEPVDVAVRVNPAAEASGGAMRMGGQPAPFGFDEERLEEVVRAIAARPGLRFSGVHMFAGTQILQADVLVGQWRRALELARHAARVAGGPLRTVDLGGGLGIPYFPNESALDLAAVRAGAEDLFAGVEKDPALQGTRIVLEPGRFLAGPAGLYLARVRAVKESRGRTFVILDGGMHHHLAASGNLGQVIKRDYPVLNASHADAAPTLEATVSGPLCTPLDTLARSAQLAPVAAGDLVAVLQSGAYGLTASPVGFLSHPMPAEVLVDGGRATLIRPAGTFEQPLTELP